MAYKLMCRFEDCTFEAISDDKDIMLAEYGSHQKNHESTARTPAPRRAETSRVPKSERPKISSGSSEEIWNTFITRWNNYKRTTSIPQSIAAGELFECCNTELGDDIIKQNSTLLEGSEENLLAAIKKLAVIPVAVCVRRSELLQLKQDHGECVRSFYARVKGKADTCGYVLKCSHGCQRNVDYTSEVIKDVVVAGLSDPEIRRDVLGWQDLDKKNAVETVTFIESKEMARNALSYSSSSSANVMHSSYRKQKKFNLENGDKEKKMGKCPRCSKEYHLYKFFRSTKRWNETPFATCFDCKPQPNHQPRSDHHKRDVRKEGEASGLYTLMGAITDSTTPHSADRLEDATHKQPRFSIATTSNEPKPSHGRKPIVLRNQIFDSVQGWQMAKQQHHPRIRLRISTNEEDYNTLGAKFPRIAPTYVNVVTDSGAQSCLWSLKAFHNCGFKTSDLVQVDHQMSAANKMPIQIVGAIILRLDGEGAHGEIYECAVMVFITPDTEDFFLSKEAMQQLAIIPKDFPQVGAANIASLDTKADTATSPTDPIICDCPKRVLPPGKPPHLPFECKPENNHRFRAWMGERYASSTYNKCPHQALPELALKIHADEYAVPVVSHKPSIIPLHHYDQVIADLKRDIAMGVLEYAPMNEPVTWCHKMVITTKHDGTPRRTIDMSALNKVCKREPHGSKTPFQMARAIPRDTWKSVQDAWNGYHSIPIREEDRHLTTFQTPIGRLRHLRAPQGALGSGDGYNQRFDIVLIDFHDKERCVDDTTYWDLELERHWWRNIEFAELAGNAGMVLNFEKFQFAQKEIEFAGFKVTCTGVEPLPKFIDAIRNFPTPHNLTDVRAWFGLTNQVAHYAQLRELVAPMRPLLKKNAKFEWTPALEKAFEASKTQIVVAIKRGVEIFDKDRATCLSTDWCKSGIGYYLMQKHCRCEAEPPCCGNGWRITLAGSRQLRPAETRYAPVEGEMLAVAWSLEQTRFFTQGCYNLLVLTDHKPLLKLLGDRTLDEINNPRLLRLKERTMRWRFEVRHRPGKKHFVADATSRNPVGDPDETDESIETQMAMITKSTVGDAEVDELIKTEITMIAGMKRDVNKMQAVTWERIRTEMEEDVSMKELLALVIRGVPDTKQGIPSHLHEYWQYRHSLYAADGVLLCKNCVLVPPRLRGEVLDGLHAAHQGVVAMTNRAQGTVTWPGITRDIQNTRDTCRTCNINAPSNPRHHPEEPVVPSMPFECVCSDFFELEGHQYLVTVDRLSGWCEVCRARTNTSSAGCQGLMSAMRRLFGTFGVPCEVSSDGGPEFVGRETEDFFKRWGVKHRRSSAYHPISNGRAELGVKSMKRLLRDNVGPGGSLDTDRVSQALLTHRNTPDPISKKSPAELLFGRRLRDTMPVFEGNQTPFNNEKVLPLWREGWALKEQALRTRAAKTIEKLSEHSRELPHLRHGDKVFIQNQTGNHPGKWDRTGTIVECRPHNQYTVKIEATGRITLRNRQFLRKFVPSEKNVLLGIPPPVNNGRKMESPAAESNQQPEPDMHTDATVDEAPYDGTVADQVPHEAVNRITDIENRSHTTANVPSDISPTPSVRKSSRFKKPSLAYDATTGKYVEPHI